MKQKTLKNSLHIQEYRPRALTPQLLPKVPLPPFGTMIASTHLFQLYSSLFKNVTKRESYSGRESLFKERNPIRAVYTFTLYSSVKCQLSIYIRKFDNEVITRW